MRNTRPPVTEESCRSTVLSGSLLAQHATRLTSLVAILAVLQAPKPRMRTMDRNAMVSFILIVRRLYAQLSREEQDFVWLLEKVDAEPPELRIGGGWGIAH